METPKCIICKKDIDAKKIYECMDDEMAIPICSECESMIEFIEMMREVEYLCSLVPRTNG